MHIALVSPGWPIGMPNGIVTYVHNLRDGLLSLGHRVSVLAFAVNSSSDMASVYRIEASWRTKTHRLLTRLAPVNRDSPSWGSVMIADTLIRLNRIDPIDVVEMEESFGWFADVQRRVPMPVLTKLHGPAFLTQMEHANLSAEIERRINCEGSALQRAQFVFAPSADTISKTFDRYGIRHLSRVVIPNPIGAVSDERYLWRADRCEPHLLLFVGRFERIKGADFLLKSFRLMLNSDPALKLVFVGPSDDTIECDGRAMTIDECIDAWFGPEHKHAVEVRGALPVRAIQELRVQAAVTLVCSRWENQPNTALEAMAQGCPVVAVGVGGVTEVIENGETGVVTPPADELQFAQATVRLLSNQAHASAIGASARARISRVHAPSSIAARTVELYEAALRGHRVVT